MPPVLIAKEKTEPPRQKAVLYRGSPELVGEIEHAARELGLSRNEAMTQLLRFALDAHQREATKKSKK